MDLFFPFLIITSIIIIVFNTTINNNIIIIVIIIIIIIIIIITIIVIIIMSIFHYFSHFLVQHKTPYTICSAGVDGAAHSRVTHRQTAAGGADA